MSDVNDVSAFSIVVEKDHGGEFRSVIYGHNHHGKWEMWTSFWGDSKAFALRKAARLIAQMPVDFVHANMNENTMAQDHPKVRAAR